MFSPVLHYLRSPTSLSETPLRSVVLLDSSDSLAALRAAIFNGSDGLRRPRRGFKSSQWDHSLIVWLDHSFPGLPWSKPIVIRRV